MGLSPRITGIIITHIASGSAAARAGLRKGDVVLEINRQRVRNTRQFSAVYQTARGKLLLLVYRLGAGTMYVLFDKAS